MCSESQHREDPDKPVEMAQPLIYVRIYSDPDGETHFSDETLTFKLVDYAPPAPPMSVSKNLNAESATFISSPPGWYGHWHPAPRRQFMLCLTGELEVEVSDGEKRRFLPGSVVYIQDTSGQGHASRVVGSQRVYMVAIPLRDQEG